MKAAKANRDRSARPSKTEPIGIEVQAAEVQGETKIRRRITGKQPLPKDQKDQGTTMDTIEEEPRSPQSQMSGYNMSLIAECLCKFASLQLEDKKLGERVQANTEEIAKLRSLAKHWEEQLDILKNQINAQARTSAQMFSSAPEVVKNATDEIAACKKEMEISMPSPLFLQMKAAKMKPEAADRSYYEYLRFLSTHCRDVCSTALASLRLLVANKKMKYNLHK
jgi:hypothetical protein